MQNLKDYINENVNNTNESAAYALGSLFSEAVFIVGVMIGYKTIKALLKGALAVFGWAFIKQDIKKLKDVQTQMAQILSKYPKACDSIKEKYSRQLSGVGGKLGSSFRLTDLGFLKDDLDFMEESDKKEFYRLYNMTQDIKERALKNYDDEELKSMKLI